MPLAHRVAVVAGVAGRLGQLLHRDVGRREVGVAEAEVDHVDAGSPSLDLQPVDDREDVRRQVRDAAELHPVEATAARADMAPMKRTPSEGCIDVVIEIPRGSRNKYEIDHDSGLIFLDRRLFTATIYPADYGFVPDTLGEDGDPLDALVLLEDPTFPGVLGGGPARRDAVDAGRGRPRRQDHLRPAEGAPLEGRRRPARPARGAAGGDQALLRRLQGARARQGVEPRPGARAARPPGARSRPPGSASSRRRTDSVGRVRGALARRTAQRTPPPQTVARRAAPMAPARSPSAAGTMARQGAVVGGVQQARRDGAAPGASTRSGEAITPPPSTITLGVEQVREVGEAERDPPGEPVHHRQRLGVALAGRGLHVLAPHGLGIAAGQGDDAPAAGHRLAASRASARQPAARGVALPAPPLAAHARRSVGVDDHVAGLAGEAVGPALQPAADHEAAADAGAQGDQHHVGGAAAGTERPLGLGGAGGVVVDDHGARRGAPRGRPAAAARRPRAGSGPPAGHRRG